MSTKNTPLRRKDRLRTETEARDIINGCDFAVLSTADSENMPYGVPVSVVLEGTPPVFPLRQSRSETGKHPAKSSCLCDFCQSTSGRRRKFHHTL